MKNEIKNIENVLDVTRECEELFNLNEAKTVKGRFENLDHFIKENSHAKEFVKNVLNDELDRQPIVDMSAKAKSESMRLVMALNGRKNKKQNKINYKLIVSSISIAAAVISLSFLLLNYEKSENLVVVDRHHINDKSLPTLVVNGGEQINLFAVNNNTIVENDNGSIKKVDNSKLMCISNNIDETKVTYNKLVIPKSYTYSIVLCDGTEVMLNANSELEYPTSFNKEERKVYLKGEGYFKVTKGDIPFIVQCDDINVKVYGTEFNVNTHKLDCVETTLVKGSIGVSLSSDLSKEVLVKPNQQFIFNSRTKEHKLVEVNVEDAMAWMSGKLISRGEALKYILSSISNWYGVEFVYKESSLEEVEINAVLYKNTNINSLLGIIESSVNIQFLNEGGGKYTVIGR